MMMTMMMMMTTMTMTMTKVSFGKLTRSISKCVLAVPEKEGIEDRTETNLVNLRRVIYLTIMNALNYEEAVHKLLKVQLKEGEEVLHFHALVFSCLRGILDRAGQHGYRVLFSRALILELLWSRQ
jgi:pre-mRNA-splicing factor CWC22